MIIDSIALNKTDFSYEKIENHVLLDYAKNKLSNHGILKRDNKNSYYYLKIDDAFIFELFPLIKIPNLTKPDYFSAKYNGGAHISVIYPEEIASKNIYIDELEQKFSFTIKDFFTITLFNKIFFALTILSQPLENLRLKYDLPVKLNYHGILIPFHITIALSTKKKK